MIPFQSAEDSFVRFAVFAKDTGQIRRSGYVGDESSALAQAAEGEGVFLGDVLAGHYILEGVPVPMGDKPSDAHAFDWQVHQWVEKPLADIRAKRWVEVKEQRDLLEASGFPYLGKRLDSDSRSVQRINTAVQAAQAALATDAPFEIVWTCADNTTLALDGPGMLGAPVALALYADQLHQTAKALRAQINAAATAAEVEAITWPDLT